MFNSFSTPHTRDTAKPQTYGEHWRVAFFYSVKMIWYGLGGIAHAFFPEIKCLQFSTSTFLFRAFKGLSMSGRHDDEIRVIMGEEMLEFIRKQRVK
ncbi:MAG: DUF6356 family protein [bacterium]|nr:DUF6356 family protein [bacterium]